MGVRSPSKYLSIKFLKSLQQERYLSPTGIEYCAGEVDELLNQKLCEYAVKCDREYLRELSRMAQEAEMQMQGGEMEQQNEEVEVINIADKRKEKEAKKQERSRLKCCDCGHEVQNEDDWLMGMDLPPSKADPTGAQDSGIYVCPQCHARQDHTIFDGMVKVNAENGMLESSIPLFMIDDLHDMEDSTSGAKFNVVTAMANAVRMELIQRYGQPFIDQCFPSERAYLRQKLKQMEG